jgi:hypothetical protein
MTLLQRTDNQTPRLGRIFDMSHSAKTETTHPHVEELDLAIPDMDSAGELQVKAALEGVPGIQSVRLLERGAFVRYLPGSIDKDQICTLIRQAGFRASTFQDSKSGKTGLSSQ